jgi:hypothetical protein
MKIILFDSVRTCVRYTGGLTRTQIRTASAILPFSSRPSYDENWASAGILGLSVSENGSAVGVGVRVGLGDYLASVRPRFGDCYDFCFARVF